MWFELIGRDVAYVPLSISTSSSSSSEHHSILYYEQPDKHMYYDYESKITSPFWNFIIVVMNARGGKGPRKGQFFLMHFK